MKNRSRLGLLLAFICFGVAAPAQQKTTQQETAQQKTALDRYIAKPDPAYSWKLVASLRGEDYRAYIVELTSQKWRSEAEVDRPVWKHWLTIVKPDKVAGDKAVLFIGGGNNRGAAPATVSSRAANFAVEAKTVAAELGMVPNQPLFFSDSKDVGRFEDDLIAYTRVKHMKTGDDEWLVRLAMVKSGIRAMDCVQEFMASEAGGKLKINEFVVSGGSKRGWTTWLVGAMDKRVIAIMPTVIDALNSQVITRHHFEAYGFFSPALKDYVNHKLFPDKVGTPEYRRILAIEDPYNYRHRDRLMIPKYLVNASGDEFFLPDNSQFYFNDLQGEKYLRYVPNSKHNLAGTDARESLLAFYQAVIKGKARPKFSWKKEQDGSLVVTTVDKPQRVNLWQASNQKGRDFRVDTIGRIWSSSPLSEQSPGVYIGSVAKPAQGYTAFFVELAYDSGGTYPFKFTTEVSIVPDVLPFSFKNAGAPTSSGT